MINYFVKTSYQEITMKYDAEFLLNVMDMKVHLLFQMAYNMLVVIIV